MMIEENIPNGNVGGAGDNSPSAEKVGSKKLTLEKIYQKKSQLEHILLRPDTYIGSVEPITESQWLYDEERNRMVKKEISYVPGLYKIFDEILVNAADNKQRDDKNMTYIKIEIDPEKNVISVLNNGQGIPVAKHKEENMYIPTMIFGHLLTSSNYNDEEAKVTGGRNGFGAKLCNIFSTKFTVKTASSGYKKEFEQTWQNNMTKAGEVKLRPFDGKPSNDYTKVTFYPDLSKFNMEKLDEDIIQLMTRRAFDVAASTGVKVFLNGKKLPVGNFKDYVNLFVPKDDDEAPKVVYERVNGRWEIALSLSKFGFQHMSFVNSIATTKGGRHVDHVTDSIVKYILEKTKKKHKGTPVKGFQVKNMMWVFINCLIVNPSFDSQTKENMTTQVKSFGSKCDVSETFLKNMEKNLNIVAAVIDMAKSKDELKLAKSSGKKQNKLNVPKLEDANNAGTRKSMECTLILTEGDSAKTLAVAGLSVVGRDSYGVFPLRGKLLNVREASPAQMRKNAEINFIVKILGLNYEKKYESVDDLKTLRYGKLMIMTDQDLDGSHIKGLLINFIHHKWPSLLRLPFLEEFITPIVKASKNKEVFSFFSLPEFEEWKKDTQNWHTYHIKYYKGLGTSTSAEAKEYFKNMARHKIKFAYGGPNDDTNITMAFSKKCVEQRKEWLTQWMETIKQRREMGLPEDYLYEKQTKSINYSDFVNKELVLFSNSDNERSIPNLMDGLKPGQRKVMFTCLKRNDKKEVKVVQLAGSVAECSAYHHGETSLMGTIVVLAQDYVGSNNINLLLPTGQFGTRLLGGKDQASPRYIFTKLSPLVKYIFHPDDQPLLIPQYDDNLRIEPVYYAPIIPMVLVNGAEGIGTGWSTKIPNFNPREIIKNLYKMIDGEEPDNMVPWYKNFRGTIECFNPSKYFCFGEVAILSESSLEITELPIGVWTETYKQNVLSAMLEAKVIQNYSNHSTDTTVRFVVQMSPESLTKAEEEGLHKFFKIQNVIHTSLMVTFDADGVLRKFDTPVLIMKDFFKVRLMYYNKRKNYLEGLLQAESRKLSNQARFILEKCSNELVIENKKRVAMIQELLKRGYDPDPVRAWKMAQDKDALLAEEIENLESQADESEVESESDSKVKFDYLLGMAMWSLTLERKNALLKKRDEKLQEYETLKKKSPEDLWRADLDALTAKMTEMEEAEESTPKPSVVKGKKQMSTKGSKSGHSQDTFPSPNGVRVPPKVDVETMKKYEKADKLKKVKKTDIPDDDKDEFDDIMDKPTKSLKERLGNSPEQIEKKLQAKRKSLKQTKLGFKKDSPKKRRKAIVSLEDDVGEDDEDEDAASISDSSPFTSPPERSSARRAAASKIRYNFSDESDAEWDVDNNVDDCSPEVPRYLQAPKEDSAENDEIVVSESDSEFEVERTEPRTSGGSDAMFDNLMAGESTKPSIPANHDAPASINYVSAPDDDDDEDEDAVPAPVPIVSKPSAPKKKGPATGRKPAAAKNKAPAKRTIKKHAIDSDEDCNPAPKKGRKVNLDEDLDVNIGETKIVRRRGTAPKYTIDDSDDDDFD